MKFSDEALGGAIRKDVRFTETATRGPDTANFLKDMPTRSFAGSTSQYLSHALPDMRHQNMYPMTCYEYKYIAAGENDVRKRLERMVTGHGADHDHPVVRRAVHQSLQHHPELLRTYLRGSG